MSNLNSLVDTFASPVVVFNRIKENTLSAWIPLLILVAATAGVSFWYFLSIDLYQFMEASMIMSGQEVNPEELSQILQAEAIIRWSSASIGAVATLVVYLIIALYFFLMSMLVAEDKIGFGRWMAVVAWGSLPSLISLISIAVSYAMVTPGFELFQALDKTSVASIMGLSFDDANFNVLSTLTLGTVWAYVLYGLGFKVLTRCKPITAVVVGVVPALIQFGLMSL
ncbi:YIP1 family protein [Reinekea marina]|uniref:YIP1 family protein n=1 Tax=Reinekea marina TaxID=1310421 RepID=A0ABV7WN32_9GAMM|nr:YIP1 family protein [Reinekea marina]MDN3649887.1 YIP1 family protein [Reinekea marina]